MMAAKIKPMREPMKRPITRVTTCSSFVSDGPIQRKLGEEDGFGLVPKSGLYSYAGNLDYYI
jgi:hypothetical protein